MAFLTSMAINDKLSEALKTSLYDFLPRRPFVLGGVSLFRKTSVANSGAVKNYQGRSRLAVLRQNV